MPDARGVQCSYQLNGQTTSILTCPGLGSVAAYSGHNQGRNNPKFAATPDIGPIPPGTYYIVDRESGGLMGRLHDLYDAHGWGTTDRTKWFSLYNGATRDKTIIDGV